MKIAFEIYPPLKMSEDGNNINGLPYQNCIKTEPGRSKRRYSDHSKWALVGYSGGSPEL